MAGKQLQEGSLYDYLDADGDGIITDEEMARAKELADFDFKLKMQENTDARLDQIRTMNWVALWGMILYPLLVLVTDFFGLSDASAKISEMSSIYFVSVMGILSVFIGGEAYKGGKSE